MFQNMNDQQLNAERIFLSGYLMYLRTDSPIFNEYSEKLSQVNNEIHRRRKEK